MTDVATIYAPAYARRPAALIDRHADALAELRQFHDDHQILEQKVREQDRYIARLTEYNALLLEELRTAKDNEGVAMRKLMRLAAHVSSISMLSREAEGIVKDMKEWEDQWQNQEPDPQMKSEPEPQAKAEEIDANEEGVVRMADQLEKLPPAWTANQN